MKKHGLEKREKAVRLIEQGYGKASLASALAISVGIAEKQKDKTRNDYQ